MKAHKPERHSTSRVGWLRAAVLGANDGILSTAGLLMGVVAAGTTRAGVLTAGVSAMAAGALSMAAGEFVSVSSQADAERADLQKERRELASDPEGEHAELVSIYVARGLTPALADEVARQLTAKDALAAHARDELGITEVLKARPLQAALASALSFLCGAVLPILVVVVTPLLAPAGWLLPSVALLSLLFLALLGGLAAQAGGASVGVGALRVTLWGAVAMSITAGIGEVVGMLEGH